MGLVMTTAIGVSIVGVVVMYIGYRSRLTEGPFLLFFGAALIVGSMSPLTKGYVPDAVQILFSAGAIVLALAGSVTGLAEVLRRRASGLENRHTH